uniref:Alkylated DNA repair protein alkB homolog 8 n=1 Tax=Caenorhabditis japonica TaxID=281687 RepID=A0A8R1E1A6_CAEJA
MNLESGFNHHLSAKKLRHNVEMYYNAEKIKPAGARFDGGKLAKRVHKSVAQLKRHDPDVQVSQEPTKFLLVSNSSILCEVSLEELEEIFLPLDEHAEFIVYPNKRSYSFVQCSSVESAIRIRDELHGLVPKALKTSHQPFIISFVDKTPEAKQCENFRPADLEIVEDYVSESLENELLALLMAHPNAQSLKHRAVAHFGHVFDYSTNSASEWKEAEPIPQVIEQIVDRLISDGYITERPDQVTVNVYEPGHGIPSHYDTHSAFEDPIVSISLLSDVVMEFKDGANSATIAPVLLKARSLCLIQGESRYRWKHGIVNRKYDVNPRTNRVEARKTRVSLTLRKIRRKPCECRWKEFCDWDRQGEMSVPASEDLARKLENSYVSDVYENIASHFDETRHSSWKAVKQFIDDIPRGSLMYDVGCGNGKYLIPKDGLHKIGCDMCMGLCEIAYRKDCHVARCDALALPFRDASADAAISIAVLHHIATLERRKRMIEEMLRVVKVGSLICVTVWSMDQSQSEYAKMRGNKDEVKTEEKTDRLRVHDGKNFEQQDVLVPWTISQKGETFLRYYHVFREGEAEHLIGNVAGCELVSVEKEQGNYIIIARKI